MSEKDSAFVNYSEIINFDEIQMDTEASVSEKDGENISFAEAENISEKEAIAPAADQEPEQESILESVQEDAPFSEEEKADFIPVVKEKRTSVQSWTQGIPPASATPKQRWYQSRLFGSIIMLFVSAAILVATLFCPLAYSRMKVGEKTEGEIEFRSVDTLEFLYYSLHSMSDKSLSKQDVYKEAEKIISKYDFDNIKRFTPRKQEALKTLCKNSLIISLASEDNELRFDLAFAAGAVLVFVLVSAVLFLKSLRELISEIAILGKPVRPKNRNCNRSVRTLWLLTGLLPLLIYTSKQTCNWGTNGAFSYFSAEGYGFSYGLIIISALSVLTSLYFAVLAFCQRLNTGAFSGAKFRKKIILFALLVLLMISIFMPALSFTVSKSSSVNAKTDVFTFSVEDLAIMQEDEIDYYKGISSKTATAEMKETIKSRFTSKKASVETFHNDLVFGVGRNNVGGMYIAIQSVTVALLLAFAFIFKCVLTALLHNDDCSRAAFTLKLCSAFLALAYSLLCIILTVLINFSITTDFIWLISVGFGIGPILCLLVCVGLFIVKTDYGLGSYADTWYDNSDVSYAPYVVEA